MQLGCCISNAFSIFTHISIKAIEFLYITFLITYYLIIIKIICMTSFISRIFLCLYFSPGHTMFIYRHVITSKFTLWWSVKLNYESKYLNTVLFTNVNYSLLKEIKYCVYYNVVVYDHWKTDTMYTVKHIKIYISLKRTPFFFFITHISIKTIEVVAHHNIIGFSFV